MTLLKRAGVVSIFRREDGNVTVEFVLLFPALLAFLGFLIDVSYVYYVRSQVVATVQDVNRQRAVGDLETDAQARDQIVARLGRGFTDEAVVTTSVNGSILRTNVTLPLHDMQILGFVDMFMGDMTVTVGSQQYVEPYDIASYDPDEDAVPPETGTLGFEGDADPPATDPVNPAAY